MKIVGKSLIAYKCKAKERKKVSIIMKQALFQAFCILLCTLCIIFIPTEAEAAIYKDTIRLHILAPSDSTEDQTLKLKIRDRVLQKYGYILNETNSIENAARITEERIGDIEDDVHLWIRELGYSYTARVEIKNEWYSTREYADFTLPAGEYLSLKITIGEGEGQNWWCVMYPPMCLDASVKTESEYTAAEESLIKNDQYRVKFKLLEVSSELFKRRK